MKCLYQKHIFPIAEPYISFYNDDNDEPISRYVEPVGQLLCDILNENFSNFKNNKREIKKLLADKGTFEYVKKIVDHCFLYIEEYSFLTPIQRAYALFHNNIGFDFEGYRISLLTEFRDQNLYFGIGEPEGVDLESIFKNNCKKILERSTDVEIRTKYMFFSLDEFLRFYILEMLSDNILIKKCKNCERYFIPENRSDTKYCDNKSPQDANKTCQEYGAIDAYKKKLKEDTLTKLYRSIYMQKQMLTRRNPDISAYKEDFDKYKAETKLMKSDLKKGLITEESFIKRLEEIKSKK